MSSEVQETVTGGYAYCADIAHYLANLPRPTDSTTRWIDDEDLVRTRWHALVGARQTHLRHG